MRKLKYVKLFENFEPNESKNSKQIWGIDFNNVMQEFTYDNYNLWIDDLDDDDKKLIKKFAEKVKNDKITKERFNQLLHRGFDVLDWKKKPEFLQKVSTKEEPEVSTKEEPEVSTKEEPEVSTKEEPEVSTKKKFLDNPEYQLKPLTMNLLYEPTEESKKKVDEFFENFLKEEGLSIKLEEIKTRVCKTNAAMWYRNDKDQFYKTLHHKLSGSWSAAQSLKKFFVEEEIFKNNN